MHLLDSESLELRESQNEEDVPYAILSHTWGDDEVLFHEIQGFSADTTPAQIKKKAGYKKIEACCAQAARDGFEYVWIDTCCIDKRSTDVPNDLDIEIQKVKFKQSRWFTRGWTLQELIAPYHVEFYGSQWHSKGQEASLGTKLSLQEEISSITGIPRFVLRLPTTGYGSIAQRMSWAAKRETARVEDRAYSLLGLFDVNMPLLYGEGSQAFVRLQEEIVKRSTDESLFAWDFESPIIGDVSLTQGLLATSPEYFAKSGSIVPQAPNTRTTPWSVTNRGVRLEIILQTVADIRKSSTAENSWQRASRLYAGILNCIDTSTKQLVGIPLVYPHFSGPDSTWERPCSADLMYIEPAICASLESTPKTIFVYLAGRGFPNHGPFHQEDFSLVVWLKNLPIHFRLVEDWPRDILGAMENGKSIPRLIKIKEGILSAIILLDDGLDAFIVAFGFYLGMPRVEVLRQSPGKSPEEGLGPDDPISHESGGVDRAIHRLGSGRVVSVSLRPQQKNESFSYVLEISI